jgi:hypothetical protein
MIFKNKTTPMLTLSISSLFGSKVEITTVKPVETKVPITINAHGEVIAKSRSIISSKSIGVLNLKILNSSYIKKGQLIAKINIDSEYQQLLLEGKNIEVIAPKDGFILELLPQHSYVVYGQKIASLIDDVNMIKIFVEVKYARELKKGMSVELDCDYKGSTGEIIDILPKKIRDTLIEAVVKPKIQLPLNLRLNTKIILKEFTGLEIPKKSIVMVENSPAVFIIKDGVAYINFVEIINDRIETVLIKKSFSSSEDIALDNAHLLKDNQKVKCNTP